MQSQQKTQTRDNIDKHFSNGVELEDVKYIDTKMEGEYVDYKDLNNGKVISGVSGSSDKQKTTTTTNTTTNTNTKGRGNKKVRSVVNRKNVGERFTLFYPQLIDIITKTTSLFFSLLSNLTFSVGSLVLLAILIQVEYNRLTVNLAPIEPNVYRASLIATFLIVATMFSEASIKILTQDLEQTAFSFTFKEFGISVVRFLFGDSKELDESHLVRKFRNSLVFAIVFINFWGTTKPNLEGLDKEWGVWFNAIATNPEIFFTILEGLVVTLVAVFGSIIVVDIIMNEALKANKEIRAQATTLKTKNVYKLKDITPMVSRGVYNHINKYSAKFNDNDYIDLERFMFYDGATNNKTKNYSNLTTVVKAIVKILDSRES